MSCCGSKPPDLSGVAAATEAAAKVQAEVAQDQLAWAKEQDSMNRETLGKVLDIQLPIMETNYQNAKEDRARYKTVFQPLEDNLVRDFQNFDTPARREMERGRAIGDVSAAFDAQRRNALQRLESFGVDPSQTRNAALDVGMRTQQAAEQARAGTNAVRNVEDKARALRADAINIGKGLPSQVAASYGTALQSGNSAVGNSNQTTGTSSAALSAPQGYFQGATSGYGQAANIQTQNWQNQNAASSQLWGGVGSLLGMGAMMMADGGSPSRRRALTIENDTGMVDEGPSDGSGIDDQVPAMVSKGEYVIPADVVKKKGLEFFDKLVEKYHTPAAEQRQEQRRALPVGG